MTAATRRESSSFDPDAYLRSGQTGMSESRGDRFFTVKPSSISSGHADTSPFMPLPVEIASRNGDFAWLAGEPDGVERCVESDASDAEKDEVNETTDTTSETSEPEPSETTKEEDVVESDEESSESSDASTESEDEPEQPEQPKQPTHQQAPTLPWETQMPPPYWYHPFAYAPGPYGYPAPAQKPKSKKTKKRGKKEDTAKTTPLKDTQANVPQSQTAVPSEHVRSQVPSPLSTRGPSAWGVSVLVPRAKEVTNKKGDAFGEYEDGFDSSTQTFQGLGRYNLADDLCHAVWSIAKGNLDVLQPVFYAHDASQKGYLNREELRAMLRDLEPQTSQRQLDRVEAMVGAGDNSQTDTRTKTSTFPPTTLDALVRAAHGGAAAAARLDTAEGCLSAAALVAQLENALVNDSQLLNQVFAVDVDKLIGESVNRRRARLHHLTLNKAPRVLLPSAVRVDPTSVRLLLAALDAPMGLYSGTGADDLLIDDPKRFPERLKSLRMELSKHARYRTLLKKRENALAKNAKQEKELQVLANAKRRAEVRAAMRDEPIKTVKPTVVTRVEEFREHVTAATPDTKLVATPEKAKTPLKTPVKVKTPLKTPVKATTPEKIKTPEKTPSALSPVMPPPTPPPAPPVEELLEEVRQRIQGAVAEEKNATQTASLDIDKYYEWTRERRARVLEKWAETQYGQLDTKKTETKVTAEHKSTTPPKKDIPAVEPDMKGLTSVVPEESTDENSRSTNSTPDRKEFVESSLDAALADASGRYDRARQSVEELEALVPLKFTSRKDE